MVSPRPTALIWLVIVTLGVLGSLPCVIHCDSNHADRATPVQTNSLIAWFLCDRSVTQGLPGGQPVPHHHHVAPQIPLQPVVAFVGVVSAALLLTGRLLLSLGGQILPLRVAPPTPPPQSLA